MIYLHRVFFYLHKFNRCQLNYIKIFCFVVVVVASMTRIAFNGRREAPVVWSFLYLFCFLKYLKVLINRFFFKIFTFDLINKKKRKWIHQQNRRHLVPVELDLILILLNLLKNLKLFYELLLGCVIINIY